jgi:hypothetical protein
MRKQSKKNKKPSRSSCRRSHPRASDSALSAAAFA